MPTVAWMPCFELLFFQGRCVCGCQFQKTEKNQGLIGWKCFKDFCGNCLAGSNNRSAKRSPDPHTRISGEVTLFLYHFKQEVCTLRSWDITGYRSIKDD